MCIRDSNYIGEDYMDVLADGCWEKYFTEKPPVFTKEEKRKWLSEYAKDVTLGSDAFFPFDDNIERAYPVSYTHLDVYKRQVLFILDR